MYILFTGVTKVYTGIGFTVAAISLGYLFQALRDCWKGEEEQTGEEEEEEGHEKYDT